MRQGVVEQSHLTCGCLLAILSLGHPVLSSLPAGHGSGDRSPAASPNPYAEGFHGN